jgi:cell division protein FtsZ
MSSTPDTKPAAPAVGNSAALIPDGGASPCVIKVVGVGGAGGNAVMRMIQTGVEGVGFAAINTDAQALAKFKGIATAVNSGRDVTRGLAAAHVCAVRL